MLGEAEVTAFLNHLAAERQVAAATQNQALSAILFLYREVPGRELPWLDGMHRPSGPPRLPVVLTRAEMEAGRGRLRHPHCAGPPGALGRLNDHDLYACAQQGRARGAEPARPLAQ